ncbi:MAG: class I SAM-dependent rRNA methyltransferase [Bacteroidia bacterium]|nr:class I SAM-dependent rRNA methyltransferase [Bacteroidia bacterium]
MHKIPAILLKPGKERSLLRFHLWVFSGAIKKIMGAPVDGDIVEVFDNNGTYLATGHYQKGSITVRIFSFTRSDVDEAFWMEKIASAVETRRNLGFLDNEATTVFRLIHGEGDNLPGLIADYYNGVVVLQAHSAGMFRHLELFAEIFRSLPGLKVTGVLSKSSTTIHQKDDNMVGDKLLWGEASISHVSEYGLRFVANHITGQKTGFFIDQRENRHLVTRYAKDRLVANVFGYTGGFSAYALQGGATAVHTVDISARAVEMANHTMQLNFGEAVKHEGFTMDAFEFFKQSKGKYGLIILDPPAFAKHRDAHSNAMKAYARINTMAFEALQPGGILFTFSCSQVISREDFRKAVFTAAASTGRNVRILHQLTQPADHPVNLYHPETEYLKGLVMRVE